MPLILIVATLYMWVMFVRKNYVVNVTTLSIPVHCVSRMEDPYLLRVLFRSGVLSAVFSSFSFFGLAVVLPVGSCCLSESVRSLVGSSVWEQTEVPALLV